MGTHTIPTTTSLVHKIGAISFSDYSKLKVLYLPANATDSSPKSLYDLDDSEVYTVPTGYVFIAGLVSCYLDHATTKGRIGESTSQDGAISREQMCFGKGTTFPATSPMLGVFRAGKYVTGESTSGFSLRTPTYVYGIEVLATPAITVQFDIGGYLCTDYSKIKILQLPADASSSSPKTFHDVTTGADYQVPASKVFIAGYISYYIDYASNMGIVGESDSADSAHSKEIFSCGEGGTCVKEQEVFGVFAAEKYVTAESTSGFSLRKPTFLYGVEIDA
jgi:hypothetical protein